MTRQHLRRTSRKSKKVVGNPSPDQGPFLKYAATLPTFRSVREINRWVRALRDEGNLAN